MFLFRAVICLSWIGDICDDSTLALGTPSSVGVLGSPIMPNISKASSPIVAVTVFMYVMLVASSQFTLVNVSMVMVGPPNRPCGISSGGTSMVTCGGQPLVKDQTIFQSQVVAFLVDLPEKGQA